MILWTKLSDSVSVPIGVNMLIAFGPGWTTAYLDSDGKNWIGKSIFLPFNRVTHFCVINMPKEDEK